jgi:MoxR-like ATPase
MNKEPNRESAGIELVERLEQSRSRILKEINKAIVGQERVIDEVLIALFAKGHILLVGVPGLAKTLLVSTLARILDLKFQRIQFTPDLMPSDIVGTDILEEDVTTGRRSFAFVKGPVFANIILADEINRTPPKTQSALLQAMQEYAVTVGGTTYPLAQPFLVLATQNPIEMEGTYPLPEAQLDRFMFNTYIDYPSEDETIEIVEKTTATYRPSLDVVLSGADILASQELVRSVPVARHVTAYAVKLTFATRPADPSAPDFVKKWVEWGAGPRASQYMVLGGKARAVLHGNTHVCIEDIRAVARSVLRHRIIPNYAAEAEGKTSMDIIEMLLDCVPRPKE